MYAVKGGVPRTCGREWATAMLRFPLRAPEPRQSAQTDSVATQSVGHGSPPQQGDQ